MEKSKRKALIILIIAFILILAGIGGTYYFYTKYNEIKNNPNIVATKELELITAEVSKLMELPTNETPSLATVEDKESLSEQEFFSTTENGDKLLIYTSAKIAILYRPSTNKIIKVAPLFLEEDSTTVKDNETNTTKK